MNEPAKDELPSCLSDTRPLRIIFIDLNSFFVSVEQQENPELRGKPVVVVPVLSDTSCVIAASYEAKRLGIQTGTNIGIAKQLCPDLEILLGQHPLYVDYHQRVLKAVESVLPIEKVCSIDEVQFRLIGKEQDPANAILIANQLKSVLWEKVGEVISCSVGIAPNIFLAKMGTKLQKPNGLVLLEKDEIYEKLSPLKLTDFTGINKKMAARLSACGIFNGKDLLDASRKYLLKSFGSITGERWWYELRGYEIASAKTHRRSLGHSHVLPPEFRTIEGSKDVLFRLLHKAVARLHVERLWVKEMHVYLKAKPASWSRKMCFSPTQDQVKLTEILLEMLKTNDLSTPTLVGITFSSLIEETAVTPSLFDSLSDRLKLNLAIDELNQKFGKHTIFPARIKQVKKIAIEKIAFQKTKLLNEGKEKEV